MSPCPVTFGIALKDWVAKEANLDRFVYTISQLLRISGVGITTGNTDMSIMKYILVFLAIVPFSMTHLFGVIYHCVYHVSRGEGNRIDMVVQSAFVFLSCILCSNKMWWLLIKRREIARLITAARELGAAKISRSSWLLATMYTLMIFLSATHRLIVPLRLWKRVLPEAVLLPGLERVPQSPDYEITYFLTGCGFYLIVSPMCSFFALFIGLTSHVSSHYQKLYVRFKNLTTLTDDEDIKTKLSELIDQHIKIIKLTKQIRTIMNPLFGFDFGVLTIGIGILLLQISNTGFSLLIDFIIYYVLTLLVYCIPGENVTAAADKLSTAVWGCGWERLDARAQGAILHVLHAAQAPQLLTAATFVPVTYKTFVSILKTCFSIYAAFDAVKN